jgi:hypothetical protein
VRWIENKNSAEKANLSHFEVIIIEPSEFTPRFECTSVFQGTRAGAFVKSSGLGAPYLMSSSTSFARYGEGSFILWCATNYRHIELNASLLPSDTGCMGILIEVKHDIVAGDTFKKTTCPAYY